MVTASAAVTTVFVSTVAAVAILLGVALRRALPRAPLAAFTRWAVVLAATIALPAVLARAGLLDRYSPLPAPALVLIATITIGTIALALSSLGARLATAAPLSALVGYQAFRVPVEWVLHRLYLEGVVPVQMTYAGRNFDVLSGLGAAVLWIAMASGRRPRVLVYLWNGIALGLLANIVAIAVLSTPVPFRAFTNDPPNLLPSTFPFVWLPTFLVQAALFGHLVVFRALRADGRRIT